MIYKKDKFLVIAGPCSLESLDLSMRVAETLATAAEKFKDCANFVFKGSFDKANRTSISSKRGPGIDEGLKIFEKIKTQFGFPTITDIHETSQCERVAEVCDALQIPAFLCRQTDLLVAAAKTGKCVNVKKGQFLSPHDMKYAVAKLKEAGAGEVWQTERGTTFGYGNLVVDMRGFSIMKQNETPVIFDVTHSLQLPSAGTSTSGGDRQYALPLALAATAAGADGIFVETHPSPDTAISDAATQLPLDKFEYLLEKVLAVKSSCRGTGPCT